MGNPTTYRGYTMTWRGKQLAGFTNGTKNIAFEYNEDGLRQQKTYNGVVTDYYYNGSVLIGMQRGTAKERFSYDAAGNVVSVNHNGTEYYYLRNAQGDIVKIVDASGNTVVEYTYDTWGKKVSTTGSLAGSLGLVQPFRYRGYVYDWETGLYYLQSRYYDPTTGRFISADVLLSTGQGVMGHNCYAYCLDNPVMMRDDRGGTSVSILFVEDSSTSYNNETEVYTTTITYTVLTSYEGLFFDISLNCSYSVSLQFTIDQDGIVHVSNDQKDMASIANPPVGIAFAHEILKTTKGINENFLAGRTADGIEFEMVVHYMAYLANPSQKNAKSIEIGSSIGSIGYDSNAIAFEQPIENRDIWFRMIKQYLKIE